MSSGLLPLSRECKSWSGCGTLDHMKLYHAILAMFLVGACSGSPDHPPVLGDNQTTDDAGFVQAPPDASKLPPRAGAMGDGGNHPEAGSDAVAAMDAGIDAIATTDAAPEASDPPADSGNPDASFVQDASDASPDPADAVADNSNNPDTGVVQQQPDASPDADPPADAAPDVVVADAGSCSPANQQEVGPCCPGTAAVSQGPYTFCFIVCDPNSMDPLSPCLAPYNTTCQQETLSLWVCL